MRITGREISRWAKPRSAVSDADDRRHVVDLVFRQVAGLGAGVCDQLLAVAVIKLLGDGQRLVGVPAPALAAGLLQGRQVEQTRRPLALLLHRHRQRTLAAFRRLRDRLRPLPVLDAVLGRRRVAHREAALLDGRGGDDLEIILRLEIDDLKLAHADDGQRRRLDPADPDHALGAASQQCRGRGPCQGKIENLVGLLPRHRRLVDRAQFRIRLQALEGIADRLGVLRRENGAHHLAAIAHMLQDLLPDQLPLAVAVGRKDHPVAALQRRRDRLKLGLLVAVGVGAGRIKPVGFQQRRGPALPLRIDLVRFRQTQQVPFRRQNLAEPVAQRHAQVFGLTGFFRDDDGCHGSPAGRLRLASD